MKRLRRRWAVGLGLSALGIVSVFVACGSDESKTDACDGRACDAGPDVPIGDQTPSEMGPIEEDGAPDAAVADSSANKCLDGGQPGALDLAFGTNGIVTLSYPSESTTTDAVVIQPDGRILLAGTKTSETGPSFALWRLLPNGAPDVTFGLGGMVETRVGNTSHALSSIALQSDGKILVAGFTRFVGKAFDFAVLRYLPNGTLDQGFASGGVELTDFSARDDKVRAMLLQPDGKILVGGQSISDDGSVADMAFARYNGDGVLDTTFGANGRATIDVRGTADEVRALALTSDGRVVAVGSTQDPGGGRADIAVIRLTASGALDGLFGASGKVIKTFGGTGSQVGRSVALDNAGRINVFGFVGVDGPRDFASIRLATNGSVDDAFGTSGTSLVDFQGADDNGTTILIEGSGRLLLVGSSLPAPGSGSPRPGNALARQLPNGTLDTTFGTSGRVFTMLPNGYYGSGLATAAALTECGVVVVGPWSVDGVNTSIGSVVKYWR